MRVVTVKPSSHPDVVEGVGGVPRVIDQAVSSIVALREGYP